MRLFYYLYKGTLKIKRMLFSLFNYMITFFYFRIYKVSYNNFVSNGIPFLHIERHGKMIVGVDFKMNNGLNYNPIGYSNPCVFVVLNDAILTIGNAVGMSQTTIVCHEKVSIGDNVKMGGGVKIYDTDFHSLAPDERLDATLDRLHKKTAPVKIADNVFIGAGSIILKGIIIGENSIVGAGSVVTKSIGDNEIWGGNPAKFIKYLNV